ncbi:MAG: hypothetical protein M1546_07265 [Chloroflexi bacterium]|nr:hypothetical protein [Chloroflexota bacterium]
MNSRERVISAIHHREPDGIPFDLGGMAQSGIHRVAYQNLRQHLSLPPMNVETLNVNTQQARLDVDFQRRLRVDAHLVYGQWASPSSAGVREDGDYLTYTDEWHVGRRMSKKNGYYFDVHTHPLASDAIDEAWAHYTWPDPTDPSRFKGLKEEASQARQAGRYVVLMGLCPGIVEMYAWLRGYELFYTDLATEPKIVAQFLDKMVELKATYWQHALAQVGDCVDAVNEADDMAGQTGLLFSPNTYRHLIKPYHRKLFAAIKQAAPQVHLLFHSCGAIRPLVGDLIEIGVDILNPVQITAKGMDPFELKREFGRDIVFWGGGVDAQQVLGTGPAQKIRDDVRRNIEALAPGGGFVFAPTHIIQPETPPENIMVMWETFQAMAGSL